jgi:uncharacterized protein
MKKAIVTFIALAVLIYAGVCVALYASQRALLYFPTPEAESALAEALRIETGGLSLKVWRLGNGSPRAIVYFGGNAEDVAWNIEDFAEMFAGATVYLVNYRGFGGSGGVPSEVALLADSLAIYDHVRASHEHVAVIGRSLGSGVAMHVAAQREVERLVLVTPYDSILEVARRHFSIFPVAWLLRDRYDSVSLASKVKAPVLVLLAERDRLIPRRHSERLIAALPASQVDVRMIEAVNHDSIIDAPAYRTAVREFLLAPRR